MKSSLQSNSVLASIKDFEASITSKLAHLADAQGGNQFHHHRRIAFIGIGDIGTAATTLFMTGFLTPKASWTLFMPVRLIALTTFLRYRGGSLSAEVSMSENRWFPFMSWAPLIAATAFLMHLMRATQPDTLNVILCGVSLICMMGGIGLCPLCATRTSLCP